MYNWQKLQQIQRKAKQRSKDGGQVDGGGGEESLPVVNSGGTAAQPRAGKNTQ